MEDALLEFLRLEVCLGKQADNSFNNTTWEGAVGAIQLVMPPDTRSELLLFQKVQQKFEHLKKDFAAFTHMKNTSRMGWDDATQHPTCILEDIY